MIGSGDGVALLKQFVFRVVLPHTLLKVRTVAVSGAAAALVQDDVSNIVSWN